MPDLQKLIRRIGQKLTRRSITLPKLRREQPGFALAYEVVRSLLRGVLPGVLGGKVTLRHRRSTESLPLATRSSRPAICF